MNLMSVNIRGLGNHSKSDFTRKIRRFNDIGFMMLQETQFVSLDGMDLHRFWGDGDFMYEQVDATGRSGGISSFLDMQLTNE